MSGPNADLEAGPDTDGDPDPAGAALLARARAAYLDVPVATAPATLIETAMRTVSLDLRPARRIALGTVGASGTSGTSGYVTDIAVANAIRLVLDGDPAVIARRCRVESGFDGLAATDGGLRIWLSVAVSYAHYDRHGDQAVRARVGDAVRELFGLPVQAVDIDVVDVFTAEPTIDPEVLT